MLLAAGEGTRLRPLTCDVPKPMLPVAGKPLLQRNLEYLARSGVREIAVNLHHRPEAITRYFGDGGSFGVHIHYSREAQLLGTAGAVKKLETFFTETFLLLYGDNLTTCNLDRLTHFHRRQGGVATVALYPRADVSQSGVAELDGDDRITRFVEKPRSDSLPFECCREHGPDFSTAESAENAEQINKPTENSALSAISAVKSENNTLQKDYPCSGETESHWVSAGVLVLEPEMLDIIPEDRPSDFGHDILPAVLAMGGQVYGYRMNEDEGLWWIDTPADYERVCAEWERRDHT